MTQRKGHEGIDWVPRMILAVIALFAIMALVSVYKDRDVEIADLHRAVYINRLYYDDIIMYRDPRSGRVYPGVVDLEKFTSKRLDDTFVGKEGEIAPIASMLTVAPAAGCTLRHDPIYNHRLTFERLEPFGNTAPGVRTSNLGTLETVSYPVVLRERGTECTGVLNITVARPNS